MRFSGMRSTVCSTRVDFPDARFARQSKQEILVQDHHLVPGSVRHHGGRCAVRHRLQFHGGLWVFGFLAVSMPDTGRLFTTSFPYHLFHIRVPHSARRTLAYPFGRVLSAVAAYINRLLFSHSCAFSSKMIAQRYNFSMQGLQTPIEFFYFCE